MAIYYTRDCCLSKQLCPVCDEGLWATLEKVDGCTQALTRLAESSCLTVGLEKAWRSRTFKRLILFSCPLSSWAAAMHCHENGMHSVYSSPATFFFFFFCCRIDIAHILLTWKKQNQVLKGWKCGYVTWLVWIITIMLPGWCCCLEIPEAWVMLFLELMWSWMLSDT